eukprot:6061223-Pyramimonas_sp.AAC.1
MSAKGDPKLMETFEKTEAKLAADQAKLKDIEKDLVAKQQQVLNDRGAYTRVRPNSAVVRRARNWPVEMLLGLRRQSIEICACQVLDQCYLVSRRTLTAVMRSQGRLSCYALGI